VPSYDAGAFPSCDRGSLILLQVVMNSGRTISNRRIVSLITSRRERTAESKHSGIGFRKLRSGRVIPILSARELSAQPEPHDVDRARSGDDRHPPLELEPQKAEMLRQKVHRRFLALPRLADRALPLRDRPRRPDRQFGRQERRTNGRASGCRTLSRSDRHARLGGDCPVCGR
jgi:hypothetical protein